MINPSFLFFIPLSLSNSCDSYGNRPVNATAANNLRQQRPAHYGSGRIRSGSMGNRTQIASQNRQQHRTANNTEAYYANFNRALETNSGTNATVATATASTTTTAAITASTSTLSANAVHFSIRKPAASSSSIASTASAAAAATSTAAGKENKENQKQHNADAAIPAVAVADK